jgi:hypothetical protein
VVIVISQKSINQDYHRLKAALVIKHEENKEALQIAKVTTFTRPEAKIGKMEVQQRSRPLPQLDQHRAHS